MVGYRYRITTQCVNSTSSRTKTRHQSEQVDEFHRTQDKATRLPMNPNVTFFEMVTPGHRHTRSLSADFNPKFRNSKPKVIAIIEENTSKPYLVKHKTWPPSPEQSSDDTSFSSTSSSSTACSSVGCHSFSDEIEEEGLDTLDGSLLPDFFTYTSAEREFIRQYHPVLFENRRKPITLGESSETSCFWAM